MNEVAQLFKRLFGILGVHISSLDLNFLASKYKFIDYNIFQFTGDFTDYNLAHLIIPIEALTHQKENYPVLCKLKHHHHYGVLEWVDDKSASIYCPWNKDLTSVQFLDLPELMDKWVVLIEPTILAKSAKEDSFLKKNKKYLFFLLAITLIATLGIFYGFKFTILLVLASFGLYICYELFAEKSGKSSNWAQEACSKFSPANGCNKVVSSSYSSFLGILPLHYLGGFYFLGLLFYLLFRTSFENLFTPTMLCIGINAIALIMGFSFLFLQVFILRSICFLCLLVLLTILVINGVLYSYEINDQYDVMAIAISAIVSATFLLLWDKYTIYHQRSKSVEVKLYKWLTNSQIFSEAHKNINPSIDINENKLLINFDYNKQRLDVLVSDTCIYCKKYLKNILGLLMLSDDYYVALHVESGKDALQKLLWLREQLTNTINDYGHYFDFSILQPADSGFKKVELEMIITALQNSESENVISKAMTSNISVSSYPMSFLEGKQINPLYDSTAIKRHLTLLKYR